MKDNNGNPIEVTFDRSYAPLRLGNRTEAQFAGMNQRFLKLVREVGDDLIESIVYHCNESIPRLDRLDLIVKLERDQFKSIFNQLVCKEKEMRAAKDEDRFLDGLTTVIQRWMAVNRDFPFASQPAPNSAGLEIALEGMGSLQNVDSPARSEGLVWLSAYLHSLDQMSEEVAEMYLDTVIDASYKEDHELLLKIKSELPPLLEGQKERIDERLAEFGLDEAHKFAVVPPHNQGE